MCCVYERERGSREKKGRRRKKSRERERFNDFGWINRLQTPNAHRKGKPKTTSVEIKIRHSISNSRSKFSVRFSFLLLVLFLRCYPFISFLSATCHLPKVISNQRFFGWSQPLIAWTYTSTTHLLANLIFWPINGIKCVYHLKVSWMSLSPQWWCYSGESISIFALILSQMIFW